MFSYKVLIPAIILGVLMWPFVLLIAVRNKLVRMVK